MSRRGRDSDSRRHRSRLDRESSLKRFRRDEKTEPERVVSHADIGDKQRRPLQDAGPLEPSNIEIETLTLNKGSDGKIDGQNEQTKHISDPTQIPRSRSYFQHDERGDAVQAGRSFGRREATDDGWWRDAKDQHSKRETETNETRQRGGKSQVKGDDIGDWRHDRFFEMEADPPTQPPSTRKRPAFSEKKIPPETEITDNTTKIPEKTSHYDHTVLGSERRVDRDGNPRHLDRQGRGNSGDQGPNRREGRRGWISSYDRYGGSGGNFRGRDRFDGRQGHHHPGGARAGKWKHDLFEDANKSPPRKNEEDQIAKVESLLAS